MLNADFFVVVVSNLLHLLRFLLSFQLLSKPLFSSLLSADERLTCVTDKLWCCTRLGLSLHYIYFPITETGFYFAHMKANSLYWFLFLVLIFSFHSKTTLLLLLTKRSTTESHQGQMEVLLLRHHSSGNIIK